VESLQCFPDLLANFNGRRKEEQRRREWVKHGWRNNGRQERDGGEERESATDGANGSYFTAFHWIYLLLCVTLITHKQICI